MLTYVRGADESEVKRVEKEHYPFASELRQGDLPELFVNHGRSDKVRGDVRDHWCAHGERGAHVSKDVCIGCTLYNEPTDISCRHDLDVCMCLCVRTCRVFATYEYLLSEKLVYKNVTSKNKFLSTNQKEAMTLVGLA
jgi:hypothetical protein